jgi:GNAT superfamily N-acetyltransferase
MTPRPQRLVRLVDGETVVLRPILPTDIFGCYTMYYSLSPETRRYTEPFIGHGLISWFMWAVPLALSSIGFLRRLLMNVLPDAVSLAHVVTNAQGNIIALSFLRLRKPTLECYGAESGIFIAEDYQTRGLGTHLLKMKIVQARLFGIREILASVHSQNSKVIGLCRKAGYTQLKEIAPNRLMMHLILDEERKS